MKTIMPVVLGSALLAAIGYATATWYLGGQAELAAGEAFRQMERIPHLKIVKRDYRRGVFSSEETVTFELFGDVSKIIDQAHKQRVAASAEAPDSPFKALEFTMRSHIRHGPLPDGRTIAAAAADSELDVEEKFKPVLAPGAGHQKLLRAHTIYRFDGEGESLVTSPPFVISLPGAGADAIGRLSWEGLRATIVFSRDLRSYAISGEAPKFEVAGKGARMMIAGMRFDTESKRIFEDEPFFHGGKQKFSVAQASFEGPGMGNANVLLKQISYDVNIPINGEFIDIVAEIGVKDVLVGSDNFGPAHYDVTLKHLHARTFAQLQRTIVKMYSDAATTEARSPGEILGPLAKPAMMLLEFDPEISLDRISFKSKQGDVLVAARARFTGVKPEDFSQPAVLFAKLDASADILLPESLLMAPWGITAESAQAVQMRRRQFAALAESGYVQLDGAMARSKLEFSKGQFVVNGKPFDPQVMQTRTHHAARPARQHSAIQR